MNNIGVFLLLSLIVIVVFIIFYLSKREKLDNFSNYLLILASCFIAFGIYAPFGFTDKDKVTEFIDTGQIGDTIGGIMNPFISIAAVIVTGLAFYAQYKANDLVRKQFELQKFENQFYEMLRLHKENVNEIEVKTADGKDIIKGREVFFEMKKELEYSFQILSNLRGEEMKKLNKDIFYEIYDTFFFGDDYIIIKEKGNNTLINDISPWHNIIRKKGKTPQYKEWQKQYKKEKNNIVNLRIEFLKGHHIYLGHYYRQMFHIVKFVVEKEFLDDKQKADYLNLLRTQLSNYEQIMLFYNWLSNYSREWEELSKENGNHFFTKYKMIKNLWYDVLYEDDFIKGKLRELVNKYKELGGKGNLFEIGDNIDKNFSKHFSEN